MSHFHQLQFAIHKEESDQSGTLTIVTSFPVTFGQIRLSAFHKELLQLIYQQEYNYNTKRRLRPIGGNTPLAMFHVSYLQSVRVLELLAATQALHFQGKRLICDLYSQTEFQFHIETCPDGLPKISGKVIDKGRSIDLSECDFVCAGSSHFYIHGISLKLIATEVSWKDLKQLYTAPALLSLSKITEDYDQEDPLQPKLIYCEQSKTVLQSSVEPLPLLVLQDRLGAFANLYMIYPLNNGKEYVKVACHDPSPWVKDHRGKQLTRRLTSCEKSWEQDLLETDFIQKVAGSTHYYCPVDAVAKSLTFLLEVGWKIEDCHGRQLHRLTDSLIEIASQQESFTIRGKISYGEHEVDLKGVIGAFNRRDRFVQLGTGGIGLLPEGSLGESLKGLSGDGEIVESGVRISRNSFGSLSDLLESEGKLHYDEPFAQLKEKLDTFEQIQTAYPSTCFKGTLRPYQQEGLNWLCFLQDYGFHGLLADDMGLGKTVQVLAFLSRTESWRISPLNSSQIEPVVVIVPTSLLFNWRREIEQFLPDVKVATYQGEQRLLPSEFLEKTIILTSYATLRIDIERMKQYTYSAIILDEAQTVKNPHTLTAQALYKLHGHFRLSLTGTPLENHASEIWAHFRFLIPGLFDDEKEFIAAIEASKADFRHMQKIRKKIRPFVLRRNKEEVAKDLPEKIEQVVWVEMSPEQRSLYEQFLGGFRGDLLKKVEADGVGKHRMEVLEAILRLRQLCCHPLLALGQLEQEEIASSAKLEALMSDLETAVEEGRKVLVYSQFTSMLHLIEKEIKNRKWSYVYLDGQTKDREKIVSKFQEDPSTLLFLISLKAGGIGLNLTAADYVFLYDPWWNEAVENQAIDRAHRIGRKETVIAKRYIAVESIEEKMMHLKAAKNALITDLMEGEQLSSHLSLDDLRYLLE